MRNRQGFALCARSVFWYTVAMKSKRRRLCPCTTNKGVQCRNPVAVKRDGKRYCKIHDPEGKAVKKGHERSRQAKMRRAETADRGFADYALRDANLAVMGYSSYKDYLSSALWRRIRKQAMKAFNGECLVCHEPASEIHHTRYDAATLRGDATDGLVALCRDCHDIAEYDTDGRKRTLAQANGCLKLGLVSEAR